jgi:hypothetical protein
MKLIGVIKGLVQDFWHENTRPSCNKKYVLKLRRGSKDYEPHIKHFLDITQTLVMSTSFQVNIYLLLSQSVKDLLNML